MDLLANWQKPRSISEQERQVSPSVFRSEDAGPWYPFDNGRTLGQPGSENGVTIYDEEHEAGARITLEKDGAIAPYSITMGIYGAMFHTHFMGSIEESELHYVGMKRMIEAALDIWNKDDQAPFYKAEEDIIAQYP